MKAFDILTGFLKSLESKNNPTWVKVLPFLTKTQQDSSLYVGINQIHAYINGIYTLVNVEDGEWSIREIATTNDCIQDFKITIKNVSNKQKVEWQCRLVKEKDVRKPSLDGAWGVNVNSFKRIK